MGGGAGGRGGGEGVEPAAAGTGVAQRSEGLITPPPIANINKASEIGGAAPPTLC